VNLAILGGGAWGTALAITFAEAHRVTLWTRDAAQAEDLRQTRLNRRYLPLATIPQAVRIEHSLADTLHDAELAVVATPLSALRETAARVAGSSVPGLTGLIWACKGFEAASAKLPHEVVAEALGRGLPGAALSGPSFALEVARGLPTALTLASADRGFGQAAAKQLHSPHLRVYSSTDVVGVSVGGAVKNVLAIAAGICDGLGFGNNARAALITRGLAEMSRLGRKLGGRTETFMGLAGVGDLVLTATSDLSRNRRVGLMLAQGETLERILVALGHVAEGVTTAPEVMRLGAQHKVAMPITHAVCRVLYEGLAPRLAVEELLSREPRQESD
jgi:glycerol-3-phosphate dehydrogenase (NAD(P)+)